ncbi:MAG: KH domain-containing protein [Candidatus Bathyarchaeia archaeon]
MYHGLIYCSEKLYSGFLFHFFTNQETYDDWLSLADKLIKKHSEEAEFRYMGLEYLPLSLKEDAYFLLKRDRNDILLLDKHGEINEEEIIRFKSKRATVDIDVGAESMKSYFGDSCLFSYIQRFFDKKSSLPPLEDYNFYRTHAGMHIRLNFSKPLTFEEKITIRKLLGDDYERRRYDELFKYNGYEALTDLLFNKKYFINENQYLWGREEALFIKALPLPYNLPASAYTKYSKNVDVENRYLVLEKSMTPMEAVLTFNKIKNDPELIRIYREKQQLEELRYKIIDTYREIDSRLADFLYSCEFKLINGVVIISVGESGSSLVGRLIGKQGRNINAIQQRVGIRIRIEQPKLPKEVEQRQKLKEMINILTS